MSIFRKLILFCFVCTCLSQIAKSNPQNHTFYCVNKFSDIVIDALEESHISGAAIAVVSKDKILYMKTYGVKSVDTGEPVNEDTLFRIASVSKFFTALVLCKLHEQGLLDLNHHVINYLPTLSLSPKTKFAKVRIKDILNHTSGAPRYSLEDQSYSRISRDSLFKNINKVNISGPPGKVHNYQNVIYSLLGLIVESATGTSFSSVLEKEIFQPLKIRNYTLCDKDYRDHRNATKPHLLDKQSKVYRKSNCTSSYDNILPAAGIAISANDAVKMIKALLGEKKPITKDMMTRLISHRVEVCNKTKPCKNKICFCSKGLTTYYGLGCRIVNISGYDVIYHAGYLNGYSSIIAIIPAIGIGLIVFTNGNSKLPLSLLHHICDIFFDKKVVESK